MINNNNTRTMIRSNDNIRVCTKKLCSNVKLLWHTGVQVYNRVQVYQKIENFNKNSFNHKFCKNFKILKILRILLCCQILNNRAQIANNTVRGPPHEIKQLQLFYNSQYMLVIAYVV